MLGSLQVLASRPLELLVILHIIIVGVDDELRQRARLLARRATEHRAVRERDRLRLLLIRTLHDELLGWRLYASNEHCRYDDTNDADDFGLHVNLLLFSDVSRTLAVKIN